MASKMSFGYDSVPIMSVNNSISNKGQQDGIDLQPEYQRGFVWEDDFKMKLIYSVIRRFPIGNVTLRITENGREVVDGQQRLTTINNFVKNDYKVSGTVAKQIIEYIREYMPNSTDEQLSKLVKKLTNKTGVRFGFKDLPEQIQGNIQSYNVAFTNISYATDEEIREYFRFLQNQDRLRAGEIIKSLPSTALEEKLNSIEDLDVFLDKIKFENQRRDFDKHFYSVIGLLTKKINYGVIDKKVLDFAQNVQLPLSNNALIDQMILGINVIVNDTEIPHNALWNANVRSTKYLLLLLAFNETDFNVSASEKLDNLAKLNGLFSTFNSAKANKEKETFSGFATDVIEDFREITLISKGTHQYDDVENAMHKLAYYVENFAGKQTTPAPK